MQLKYKLFLSFTILYIIFSTIVWTFSNYKSREINVNWIEKFVKKQVLFDKNRTLVPILNELAIVEKMVKDKDIINLAKYENDPILKQNGINALEKYREEFKDKNYFAAFATSKNYYFNNDSNNLNSNEEEYNLSENKK